jgi:hypothetical protein
MSRTAAPGTPSLPALVFMLWSILVTLVTGSRLLNADGDTARHLRHGETILATGALIREDPFSFTRPGAPFVGFEYGSQVLMAEAHRVGGLSGVVVLSALLIALTYALLARYLLRRGVEAGFAYLIVTLSAVLGSMHWAARPHLVTQLFVVVLLDLLDRDEGVSAWWYGPLFVVWANLHGGFLFGLILVAIFAGGHLAAGLLGAGDRGRSLNRARTLGFALLLGVGASFLTPYGAALPRHVLGFFGQALIQRVTNEFQPPGFRDLGTRLFLVTLLAGIAGLAWTRERISPPRLAVILAVTAFALMARRNIALWSLTALPLLGIHFDPAVRQMPEPPNFRKSFAGAAGGRTWPWVLPVVTLLLLLALAHGRLRTIQLVPNAFSPGMFPREAMALAREARLEGRVYTQFMWGGYQLYAWPEQKVFIDGGTDFYGEEVLTDYLDIWSLQPGWREKLAGWDISVAILPARSPLAAELAREPGWREWHQDSTATVLVRSAE